MGVLIRLTGLNLAPSPSGQLGCDHQSADTDANEQAGLIIEFEEPYAHGVDQASSNNGSHQGAEDLPHFHILLL